MEEKIAMGRQVYQKGLLAGGEPVEARVMGDVAVLGTQFICVNCHGRSGMGGAEGKTFTLPINPAALFAPRDSIYLARSAYDDKSLENAIRKGVTPDGRSLSPSMPLYDLPPREMTALIAYLKTLSSAFSPGLTEQEIHFATVVSDGVDPDARRAMLAVMDHFFQDKNSTTRYEDKRVERGPFYQHYRLKAYRKWVLHVWELKGKAGTWPGQLQEYYKQQPIFGMLGGMVQGAWGPIHLFCEDNRIPCLLPNTDQPGGIGTDDFYTLYFSEGLRLEARVIAAHLSAGGQPVQVLQVYRPEETGAFGGRSLQETAAGFDSIRVTDWVLEPGTRFSRSELMRRLEEAGAESVILWLSPQDLEGIMLNGTDQELPGFCYLSSSLLGGIFASLPSSLGDQVKLAHPFVLPDDQEKVFRRFRFWLEQRGIPVDNHRVLGQTYYGCLVLGEGLMHIKRHFYRDYLLDALDHGNAKSIYSVNYPRLSFGPGQRYLAKGGFVIDRPGSDGGATWIVPYPPSR